MDCLCGKPMKLLGTIEDKLTGNIKLFACEPEGCGRIFIKGYKLEITGTFYIAEVNDGYKNGLR